MPCNSDHLRASDIEKELSKVYAFIDELKGKPKRKEAGTGYDDKTYNKATKPLLDTATKELCAGIKNYLKKGKISKFSLEMQIWWRDHQEVDNVRIKREANRLENKKLTTSALSKLTQKERKALGLK